MTLFKEQIGIDLKDSVTIQTGLDYQSVNIDIEKAVSLALENRLELKEDEINIELNRMDIKRQKAQGRISGNLTFNYEFNGINQSSRDVYWQTALNNTLE